MHSKSLSALAVLIALTAPSYATAAPDETPPVIKVAGDTTTRCDGGVTELRIRVIDSSATRAAVRLDGKVVKRTGDKRFTVRFRLGESAHVIRVFARDANTNHFTHVLRLTRCS